MNRKNIIITIISVLILTCIFAYARTTTTDLGLVKPTWTEEIDILDDLNANTDILEAFANDPLEYDSDLERLEDRVGAMWAGNTETGLTITYQDVDNTIDAVIGADDIVESMLKAVNAPLDEEVFTYESTTGDFEWHTLAELSIQPLDAGLTSIAGLTTAASTLIYTTALDTYAVLGANATATNKWLRQVNSSAPSWEVIADGDVPNDITIDLATLATTFTCTDNESEALACPIVFVDGATGAQGAETDDTDFTYNPSTGALTAKMHRVYMTSESTALNAGWFQIGSTAVTGDLTGLRAVMQSDAVSGGDAASGLNVRGLYGQAVVAAGDHAGLLQGVLGVADMSAGGATVYNVHAGGSHYSSGASNTIGGDLYVHLMRSQTRSTNSRSVVGHDVILGIENEAIEGTGMTIDSAIRIFGTNTGVDDFTYGIDLNDSVIATADIRLSNGETIDNTTDGRITIGGGDINIDTGKKYLINGTALAPTDLDGTAWRVHYSDTNGDVTELALGADGTYLKSTGAASAPIFSTPAGAGDVSGPATNIDEGIARWNGVDSKALQDSVLTISDTGTLGSLSNADITIQPNGTGDTIIYAPSVVVTTSSANNTLTIAEAGLVLVSDAHTETLPTASGHTGLTYHFVKTDWDYDLITLEGDGTETFNYENSTGSPNLTYLRLNTPLAEVTIVSDGTNWQVINEAKGQLPYFKMELSAQQDDLSDSTWQQVMLDQDGADIGSNTNIGVWVSGNATSTSAGHLVDSGGAFTLSMVGRQIKNTTDTTYTYITAYTSATDITVRDDIFVDGEGYELKYSKFVVPVSGKYSLRGSMGTESTYTIADKVYICGIYKNSSNIADMRVHTSTVFTAMPALTIVESLSKDDVIELWTYNNSGVDTVDIYHTTYQTYLQGILIEKE